MAARSRRKRKAEKAEDALLFAAAILDALALEVARAADGQPGAEAMGMYEAERMLRECKKMPIEIRDRLIGCATMSQQLFMAMPPGPDDTAWIAHLDQVQARLHAAAFALKNVIGASEADGVAGFNDTQQVSDPSCFEDLPETENA